MTFRLVHKTTTAANAVFHIVNAKGDICGSVNVSPGQENDLRKCWRGAAPAARTAGEQARVANAMVAAIKRGPRLSREGVLRG